MDKKQEKFDIAIIGGGPAGIMAAITAGEKGARVVLIEKNLKLGKKLLLTGKKRCNISQAEFNNKEFTKKLGPKGDFLLFGLSVFNSAKVMEFFKKNGLETKIERGKRIFPSSDNSQDVLDVLLKCLKKNKVTLFLNQEVLDFKLKNNQIKSVLLKDKEILAKSFVLTTGGRAYPGTGSTGDGYNWAKKMGHKIIELKPILTPLKTKETWVKDLQDLTLKNVKISVFQNNKKKFSKFGEMFFTSFGISGPIILDSSRKIQEIIKKGPISLSLDLKPALDYFTLDKRLQKDFKDNKIFKNYLPSLVPQKLVNLIINFSKIDANKKISSIKKTEREKLVKTLKNIKLNIIGLMGFEHAIVTEGGIDLKQIDSKTMKSKLIKNLFFAGEIIDLAGPTGGYNLQICWTTGYLAGNNA